MIGDGSKIVGRLQGSLLLHTTSNHKVKLNHVLYLPGFNQNILSMARLLEHGNDDSLTLIKGATRLTLLKETKGGMFSLQATRLAPNPWTSVHLADLKTDNETAPKTTDINEAHDKLGHAHEAILHRTCKKLNITLTGQLLPCDACMRTKAQAKPVKKTTNTKATYVGERLFLDTSGPFPPSIKGSKYWGKICDQYSGEHGTPSSKRNPKSQKQLRTSLSLSRPRVTRSNTCDVTMQVNMKKNSKRSGNNLESNWNTPHQTPPNIMEW